MNTKELLALFRISLLVTASERGRGDVGMTNCDVAAPPPPLFIMCAFPRCTKTRARNADLKLKDFLALFRNYHAVTHSRRLSFTTAMPLGRETEMMTAGTTKTLC